jgi:hypothetical protein
MTKDSDLSLPKSYSIPTKTVNCFIYSRVVFFFALVCAISASAVGQSSVNYDLPKNWMCHPMKSTDIARQQSLTLTVQLPDSSPDTVINYTHPATNTGVDIFYVYPTIDMTYTPGNTEMTKIDTATAKFVYSEQVGIYAQFGRVFVPYYKQATIGVFVVDTLSAVNQANYMEIAYKDVESAFDNYLKYYNNGNKIILMGHSQGAYLMRFLLRNRFDNNPSRMSQLVVAISGGEPNYSSIGSRTGGSLQNIKTCPSADSLLECGCMINWRTWKKDTKVQLLDKNSFFYNQKFVDKGLIYQTYDSIIHQESNYDFGYVSSDIPKKVTCYITLGADKTNYIGFDDMFRAQATPPSTVCGSTYIMIDTINIPNDLRVIPNMPFSPIFSTIPIPEGTINYHCWDMQFFQGDLLRILPQMIEKSKTIGILEENHPENSALIYPNPSDGNVHVSIDNQKIKSIKLYNLQGGFIEEFFTNDFSVSSLTAGIYIINIQTDKSTFINKLVKQ